MDEAVPPAARLTKTDAARIQKLGRSERTAEKWCPRCSRRHQRRLICNLHLRERVAKSGRKVKRWAH